ncbi:hypothetical protein Tco_1150922 [Tanacetum coccineum]
MRTKFSIQAYSFMVALILSLLIIKERSFMSIPSARELPLHYKLPGTKTLLSFSSKNEEKVFNPGILISNGVHSLTPGLSHQNYEAFKIVNVYPNILNESPMKIFPFFYFLYGGEISSSDVPIPYDLEDLRACFQSSNHVVSDYFS